MSNNIEYFKTKIIEVRKALGLSKYKAVLCCELPCGNTIQYTEDNGNPHLKTLLKLSKGYKLKITIENGKLIIE